ncbi:MAG TPA: LssY C-terminal domain-containing protein [Candidatus Acidoferrales bacterium]|nr:LssY C-terminal domain-containing protein [Candidatus Acidoferrales bacterium]
MTSRGILALVLSLGFLAGRSVPSAAQSEKEASTPAKLTFEQMLARLPQRVKSKEGTQGDMVNFLLIGSKAKVEEALRAAGWVEADRDPQQAIRHAIESTINQQGFTEMPMSLLYLFGRMQDYGFAHAMPLQVAAERHHFRLWQAPWTTPDGQTVWIGAGTHDIGIERSIEGKLTHQIDPDVDQEREYVADSLLQAGRV